MRLIPTLRQLDTRVLGPAAPARVLLLAALLGGLIVTAPPVAFVLAHGGSATAARLLPLLVLLPVTVAVLSRRSAP